MNGRNYWPWSRVLVTESFHDMDSSFYNIPRNGEGDGMKLKILLLDDAERLCAILAERLAMEGYDVRTANNGRQGLTLYNNSPTDLVITDLLMPEVDGLEVIRTLRGLLAPPLIIAMSGGWSRASSDGTSLAPGENARRTMKAATPRITAIACIRRCFVRPSKSFRAVCRSCWTGPS